MKKILLKKQKDLINDRNKLLETYKKEKDAEEEINAFKIMSYKQYLKKKANEDAAARKRNDAIAKSRAAKAAADNKNKKLARKLNRQAEADLAEAEQLEKGNEAAGGFAVEFQGGSFANQLGSTISQAFSKLAAKFDNAIGNAINIVEQYSTRMNYRLESIGSGWDKIYDLTKQNLGFGLVAKQTAVIERIGRAVDQGIAYNVEQRAFLAEVSDKIQSTFDAFDSNLLRLVRIQAADST